MYVSMLVRQSKVIIKGLDKRLVGSLVSFPYSPFLTPLHISWPTPIQRYRYLMILYIGTVNNEELRLSLEFQYNYGIQTSI